MKITSFSKREALNFGWDKMKENVGLLVLVTLFTFLVSFGSTYFESFLEDFSFLKNLYGLVFVVIGAVIQMGFIKIAIKIHDNQGAEFSDLFSTFHLILKYFIASILYGVIVGIGLFLFIVPGIIWLIKFVFYDYLIVDKELGPLDSMRKSSELTKGVKWQLFVFFLLVLLVNMGGALIFFVGLLFTIPATSIATVYVYRKLLARIKENEVEEVQATEISEQSGF